MAEVATTHEENDSKIEQRLRNLYPAVDIRKTPLPTCWNKQDRFPLLQLTHLNLRLSYPERDLPVAEERKNTKDAASLRANYPIPVFCGIYYFEVHILQSDGFMGVGVCEKSVNMNRLPGWDRLSYGYHGDDGNFFSSSGQGTPYGPKYATSDVIGCGVNLIRNTIFFTKNGVNLGNASAHLESVKMLYPTVGLQTPKGVVDVNFGQVPFVYDIFTELNGLRSEITKNILSVRLPMSKASWLNSYVSSWFASEGHSKTLAIFSREAHTRMEEEESSVENRKEIARLIMNKRSAEAIAAMDTNYPGLLKSFPVLDLDLRAQMFLESVVDFAEMNAPSNGHSASRNGNSLTAHRAREVPFNSFSDLSAGGSSSAPASSRLSTSAGPSSCSSRGGYNPLKRRSSTTHDGSATSASEAPPAARRPVSHSRPSSLSSGRGGRREELRRGNRPRPQPRDISATMEVDDVPDTVGVGRQGQGSSALFPPVTASVSVGALAVASINSPDSSAPAAATFAVPQPFLSPKNGTSSANGNSRRGREGDSATTIVQEESGDGYSPLAGEEEEDQHLRCGYSKSDLEDSNKFEKLVTEGNKISKVLSTLMKEGKHDERILHTARMALSAVSLRYVEDFVGHELTTDNRLRTLAKHAHSCILQYLKRSPDSNLVILEHMAREDKSTLLKLMVPAAPFIDYDKLVYGKEHPNREELMEEEESGNRSERAAQSSGQPVRRISPVLDQMSALREMGMDEAEGGVEGGNPEDVHMEEDFVDDEEIFDEEDEGDEGLQEEM